MVSRFPCLSYLALRSSIPVRPRLNFAGKVAKLLYSALCAASFGAIMPSKKAVGMPQGSMRQNPIPKSESSVRQHSTKASSVHCGPEQVPKNRAAIHPIRLQA